MLEFCQRNYKGAKVGERSRDGNVVGKGSFTSHHITYNTHGGRETLQNSVLSVGCWWHHFTVIGCTECSCVMTKHYNHLAIYQRNKKNKNNNNNNNNNNNVCMCVSNVGTEVKTRSSQTSNNTNTYVCEEEVEWSETWDFFYVSLNILIQPRRDECTTPWAL